MSEIPRDVKNGSKYNPAMQITDQAEADAYFEKCVRHCMLFKDIDGNQTSREEAVHIEKSNIGYWAGYFDEETRARVNKLFRAPHPVFGSESPFSKYATVSQPADAFATLQERTKNMGDCITRQREGHAYLRHSERSVPMRRFYMQRSDDKTFAGPTGRVLEGVVTQSGKVIIEWRPPFNRIEIYDSFEQFDIVHVDSQPSCNEVVWLDEEAEAKP